MDLKKKKNAPKVKIWAFNHLNNVDFPKIKGIFFGKGFYEVSVLNSYDIFLNK